MKITRKILEQSFDGRTKGHSGENIEPVQKNNREGLNKLKST